MLLHEHLENGADKNPNFPFSEFEGNSLSYQEANLLSNQFYFLNQKHMYDFQTMSLHIYEIQFSYFYKK